MSTMKLTLIGLEKWYADTHQGSQLFDSLTLPEGIDKTTLVSSILLSGGEFEVLYPSPDFMYEAIHRWGDKWYRTFEKWVTALAIEYNPLDNFDRHEEWKDSGTSSSKTNGTGNISNTTSTTEKPTGEIVNDHYVTPYENNVKTIEGEDIESYNNYQNKSDTTAASTTITGQTGEGSTSATHTGHLYGNIGVTTSQQMLQAELDVASWNLYEHITDLFLKEFTIMVY